MRTAIPSPLAAGWLLLLAGALAGCSSTAVDAGPRCVVHDRRSFVSSAPGVDRLDLLFVVSDAPSMAEHQAHLARELHTLVRSLIMGGGDGVPLVPRVQDLQVGVVSATFADGGALHRVPVADAGGCASEYPAFLRFRGDYFEPEQDDPDAFVQSVQCMAELGSASDRPNQALEAALAALSGPSAAPGFLRSDPVHGSSQVGVVVIADTDDCSVESTAAGPGEAPASSAACAAQSDALAILERYFDGLRALRTDPENLVYLAVIAGVPPELTQLGTPPLNLSNAAQRDQFYRRILDDPSMQPAADPASPEHLLPACAWGSAPAEPARRLVSLAQRFAENGLPISICDEHWTAALTFLDPFLEEPISPTCFQRAIPRGSDGRIACKMYWDLPAPGYGPDTTTWAIPDRIAPNGPATKAFGPTRRSAVQRPTRSQTTSIAPAAAALPTRRCRPAPARTVSPATRCSAKAAPRSRVATA